MKSAISLFPLLVLCGAFANASVGIGHQPPQSSSKIHPLHQHVYEALHGARKANAPIPTRFRGPPPMSRFEGDDLLFPPWKSTEEEEEGGGAGGSMKKMDCPTAIGKMVNETGLVSVRPFKQKNDQNGSATAGDDSVAVRAAINATRACGGNVFFPPGRYVFQSTVSIPARLGIFGSSDSGGQFSTPPQVTIYGPDDAPAFRAGGDDPNSPTFQVHLSNINIQARTTGLVISNAGLVRLTNVAIVTTFNTEGVNTSYPCDGCNVVLGSSNTALVIENSFWVWAMDSSFIFLPNYDSHGRVTPRDAIGQRPSVIIKGNGPKNTLNTCYLIHFERCIFAGGAVQYQQLTLGDQHAGFFDFVYVTQEDSGTPLLDVQSAPGALFTGLTQVTIIDASGADMVGANYLQPYAQWLGPRERCAVPLVALNCSDLTDCRLDGLKITASTSAGACEGGSPAVRVFRGAVTDVTVFGNQLTGANDVVDAHDVPIGGWVSRSAGGFVLVGAKTVAGDSGGAKLTAYHDGSSKVLTVGQAGDTGARLAIESDGTVRYGDGNGTEPFHTSLRRQVSNTTLWNGYGPLAPGDTATTSIILQGAAVGDLVLVSHTGMGKSVDLEISARVVEAGEAFVILRNVARSGNSVEELASGTLRVAALQYV